MKRFMAFGVAAMFALAINVADVDAQYGCGTAAPMTYSAPMNYSSAPMNYTSDINGCYGCTTSSYAPASNYCCAQPRPRLFSRIGRRGNNGYAQNCCPTPASNCYGCSQVGYNAPVSGYSGCATTGYAAPMAYTSTVSGFNGCNSGCSGCGQNMNYGQPVMMNGCNGCGGQIMMQGTNQGTVMPGTIIQPGTEVPATDGATPPIPDDT